MAGLCQKLPVVLEIDTEKNRDAEHKHPVGYRIEDIVAYILSELDQIGFTVKEKQRAYRKKS